MPDDHKKRKRWPDHVRPISIDELNRLGISDDGKLYWDGKEIIIKRKLSLSLAQRIGTVIVTVSIASQALIMLWDWFCKLHYISCNYCP